MKEPFTSGNFHEWLNNCEDQHDLESFTKWVLNFVEIHRLNLIRHYMSRMHVIGLSMSPAIPINNRVTAVSESRDYKRRAAQGLVTDRGSEVGDGVVQVISFAIYSVNEAFIS